MRSKVTGFQRWTPVEGHSRFFPNLFKVLAIVLSLYFLAKVKAQERLITHTIEKSEDLLSAKE